MGVQLRAMVVAWLALEMTGSTMWMGLTNGLPTASIVAFSLLGGVLADRTNRRTLLMWSRITLAALSFLMALLVTLGLIEIWQLIILVILAGGLNSLDLTVSRALVFDIVGKQKILSASSMNTMAISLGNILGPSIAGVLIARAGVDAALYLLFAAYLVSFIVLIRVRGFQPTAQPKGSSITRDLAEGFRYIRRTPIIASLLALGALAPMATIYIAMMPVYSREVFSTGAQGFGFLVAAWGLGGIIGSVFLTVKGGIGHKGIIVLGSGLALGVLMIGFAYSRVFPISFALTAGFGFFAMVWLNSVNAVLQTVVSDEMRGRVIGIFTMAPQLMTLGWLLGGAMEVLMGSQITLIVSGGFVIAFSLLVLSHSPGLLRID
jgi:MFS family permease